MGSLLARLTDLSYVLLGLLPRSLTFVPVTGWVKLHYRRLAKRYNSLIVQWEPAYGSPLDRGLAVICSEDTRWILDVGTGTGYAASRLAQRFPRACIVGVDLSLEMLREAQKKQHRIIWIQAHNSRLPFRDGTFDLAIVHNAPLALEELKRVVRPRGEILLSLSSGAAVPSVLHELLRRRLDSLGCPVIRWERVGEGFFLIAYRT